MKVFFVTKSDIYKFIIIAFIVFVATLIVIPYNDGVISVFNTNREIPIYCVDTQENKVALTFDCAWGAGDIPKINDILKEYDAKATFFVVGDWMDKNNEMVKLLSSSGNEIANHSDSHLDMVNLNEEVIKTEILNANKKIENLTGKKNNLFRAPYGSYNNTLIKTAKSLNQHVIQWDVDSLDWKDLGVKSITDRIKDKVKNGSIILLHNDTKYTVEALPQILKYLKDNGFKCVTISDLIYKDNFYIDYSGKQHTLINNTSSID